MTCQRRLGTTFLQLTYMPLQQWQINAVLATHAAFLHKLVPSAERTTNPLVRTDWWLSGRFRNMCKSLFESTVT